MKQFEWTLHNIDTQRVIKINKVQFEVGRAQVDLVCRDTLVSRKHAYLIIESNGSLHVRDRNSSNGTHVNQIRIVPDQLHELHDGDEIGFGCSSQLQIIANARYVFIVRKTTNTHPLSLPNKCDDSIISKSDNSVVDKEPFEKSNLINEDTVTTNDFNIHHTDKKNYVPQIQSDVVYVDSCIQTDLDEINSDFKNPLKVDVGVSNGNDDKDTSITNISSSKKRYSNVSVDVRVSVQTDTNEIQKINCLSPKISEMCIQKTAELNFIKKESTEVNKLTNELQIDTSDDKALDTQELYDLLNASHSNSSFKNDSPNHCTKETKVNQDPPKIQTEDIKKEPLSYSVDDEGCIIINSDDEDVEYPFSQMNKVNSEPFDENIFYAIKKEVEELDRIDTGLLDPVVVEDSDSDITNLEMLLGSELEAHGFNENLKSKELPVNTPLPQSEYNDADKPSTSKTVDFNWKSKSNTSLSKQTPKGLLKTTKHFKNATSQKRKREEISKTLKKVKLASTYSKKSLNKNTVFGGITSESIKDVRGQRLKEIADKAAEERAPKIKMIAPAPVRVKVSDSRGKFLTEPIINKNQTTKGLPQSSNSTITSPHSKLTHPFSSNNKSNPLVSPLQKDKGYLKRINDTISIILPILRWDANKLTTGGELFENVNLVKMPDSFVNYLQYYSIVEPFLLLEMWAFLQQEYQDAYDNPRRAPFKIKIEEVNKQQNYSELKCITYQSETQFTNNVQMKEGDMILFQYYMVAGRKQRILPVLGYVTEVHRRYFREHDVSRLNFIDFKPHVEIKFKLLMKLHQATVDLERSPLAQIITNVVTALRVLKSVKYLERSHLCQQILKPDIHTYTISRQTLHHLHSKDSLNRSQVTAVVEATHVCCRSEPGIYLIQGPPGTGKTSVIVNIIQQVLFNSAGADREYVLVVAPSNAAVDELANRLIRINSKLSGDKKEKFKLIRMGPKSAIHPNVTHYSQHELAIRDLIRDTWDKMDREDRVALNDIEKELGMPIVGRWNVKNELKRNELKNNREKICKRALGHAYFEKLRYHEKNVLNKATIICTTLSSCLTSQMEETFRLKTVDQNICCIVDEATQSTEQETFIPLRLGINKLILVGDPKQLLAFTATQKARSYGYGVSLFARIMANFENKPNNPIKMLNVQYRMHPAICELPNKMYYGGKLQTDKSVSARDSPFNTLLQPYVVFSFTSNTMNSQEYRNTSEINCIIKILEAVKRKIGRKCGFSVGIITPYNEQKKSIIETIGRTTNSKVSLHVNTVDSFQGQEKDVIIISYVRDTSNSFVSDEQRLNVSLTRAKYALYIVGTTTLFQSGSALGRIYSDAVQRKVLKNVNSNTSTNSFVNMISR